MNIADYLLSVIGLFIAVLAGSFSILNALVPAFTPSNTTESYITGLKGCIGLVLSGVVSVYFMISMIKGTWAWL